MCAHQHPRPGQRLRRDMIYTSRTSPLPCIRDTKTHKHMPILIQNLLCHHRVLGGTLRTPMNHYSRNGPAGASHSDVQKGHPVAMVLMLFLSSRWSRQATKGLNVSAVRNFSSMELWAMYVMHGEAVSSPGAKPIASPIIGDDTSTLKRYHITLLSPSPGLNPPRAKLSPKTT